MSAGAGWERLRGAALVCFMFVQEVVQEAKSEAFGFRRETLCSNPNRLRADEDSGARK